MKFVSRKIMIIVEIHYAYNILELDKNTETPRKNALLPNTMLDNRWHSE